MLNFFRRFPALFASVLLVIVLPSSLLGPVHHVGAALKGEHQPIVGYGSYGCGVEQWSVKTGTDSDARRVNLRHIVSTNINRLRRLVPPATLPSYAEIAPVEDAVDTVKAVLPRYKERADSDYRLAVVDTGAVAHQATAPLPCGVAAHLIKHHVRTLTVHGVYKVCSREASPFGVPLGTVSVRGFYLILPLLGLGGLGVLFDHEVARNAAYQPTLTPIPGTSSQQMGVKIAPSGLVVMGPHALVPHPPPSISDSHWVVIRGPLFCHHLQQVSPFFLNGGNKPYMYLKSWRPWRKTKSGMTTRTTARLSSIPHFHPAYSGGGAPPRIRPLLHHSP